MEDRLMVVRRLLFDYVQSPSLRHIKDPSAVSRLAAEVIHKLDRGSSAWRKWDPPRERLVKAAAPCWVPIADLVDHLNAMLGPRLTATDVTQRTRAFQDDDAAEYPDERLRDGCLELFAREKAQGTELPAIIGALQEYIEDEERRLQFEQQAQYKSDQEAKRRAIENRFLAGADCKWTPLDRSKALFCRSNGRAYRLAPAPDGLLELYRVEAADDQGIYVGRYRRSTDATATVAKVAFAPDLLGS